MGQLADTRIGWENEHLATFLLSRISFVANPITVADDIGSDFFCTLFESKTQNGKEQLFPRNSFAIQIKSSEEAIPATNKIQYLDKLELPFFVGVINREHLRLRIYSGEYVPIIFTKYGLPRELRLSLVSADVIEDKGYCEVKQDNDLIATDALLRLPFIMEICAKDSRDDILGKAQQLGELCSRIHKNISAKTSQEYIFILDRPAKAMIMAGSGSATTFRRNFYLRLAEVFYNLEWIYTAQQNSLSAGEMKEFKVYENCYLDLLNTGADIPQMLKNIYDKLKQKIGQ